VNRSHAAELDRIPAPALVIVAVLSVQLGAAVAKSLFDDLTPNGVVALRLVFGGIVLGLLFRPRIRNRPRAELRLAVAFGLVLVAMNLCFFQALDRIPLGIAVTLEFIGPLGVALIGSRRSSDFLWVAMAASGIALLAPGIGEGLNAAGVAFALAAGLLWGAYILLGVRVGKAFAGPTGLVLAMGVGACVALPLGVASAGSSLLDPVVARARGTPPPAHARVRRPHEPRACDRRPRRLRRPGRAARDSGGDGDLARGRRQRGRGAGRADGTRASRRLVRTVIGSPNGREH
jgi:inner membrane transporter RhtA